MDLLQKCAVAFNRLTGYQYRFTLGRKGKLKEIVLGFGETDFHHLAGLHKLKDINIARDNRQTVFRDILSGRITYQTIEKSAFVHESYLRLETFQFIEDLLDGDQLVSCKLVACNHRHCVFTIPEELRIFFLKDRSLLSCLFHAVRTVVFRMFYNLNKKENFTPGLVCVLHTFGRDLKWNPHIHALISEGGAGSFSPWRKVTHFNYSFLRNAFCKVLLDMLSKRLGISFKKVKNHIYQNHKESFYVRAKPNDCTPQTTIKYITRYLGRPVIASSRIDKYDGDFVTFHYTRHEDNKTVSECIPTMEFIQRLIVHIPEKHFKMLRYYGIYAKHHK